MRTWIWYWIFVLIWTMATLLLFIAVDLEVG